MEIACTLKNGEMLLLRSPKKSDAAMCIEYLRRVGGETDYLLCDENGIAGLTLEGEEDYLEKTLADKNIGMFLGFIDGELVTVFDVPSASVATIDTAKTPSLANV